MLIKFAIRKNAMKNKIKNLYSFYRTINIVQLNVSSMNKKIVYILIKTWFAKVPVNNLYIINNINLNLHQYNIKYAYHHSLSAHNLVTMYLNLMKFHNYTHVVRNAMIILMFNLLIMNENANQNAKIKDIKNFIQIQLCYMNA